MNKGEQQTSPRWLARGSGGVVEPAGEGRGMPAAPRLLRIEPAVLSREVRTDTDVGPISAPLGLNLPSAIPLTMAQAPTLTVVGDVNRTWPPSS